MRRRLRGLGRLDRVHRAPSGEPLRRTRVIALAAAAVSGIAAIAAWGSAQDTAGPSRGNFTLEKARAFEEFPLYYAGERIGELPLVAVVRRRDTANYVSFVYGDCTPTSYDGGCAPPAEIQIWPGRERRLDMYDSSAPGTPLPETTTIRGRPAAFFDGGTRLEIYAGRSTVVVFSYPRERVLEIAQALRCVTGPAADTLVC